MSLGFIPLALGSGTTIAPSECSPSLTHRWWFPLPAAAYLNTQDCWSSVCRPPSFFYTPLTLYAQLPCKISFYNPRVPATYTTRRIHELVMLREDIDIAGAVSWVTVLR
jgi:hypothetical protein